MKIRISQYAFEVGEPYQAGHVITAIEAKELNRLRAENIRNNVRRIFVDQALQNVPDGQLLDANKLFDLIQKVESYARLYAFGGGASKPKITWFEQQLREYAAELVETELRALEMKLEPAALDLAIEDRCKRPEVIEEARRRATIASDVAQQELQDLLS